MHKGSAVVPFDNIRRPADAPASVTVGTLEVPLDVRFVDLDVSTDAIGLFLPLLSDDEVARAEGFRFALHRDRYIAGRAALRHVLAEHLGSHPTDLRFSYGPFGKPFLREPRDNVEFNLAHCGRDAVIAVTRGAAVGVDIEIVRSGADVRSLARNVFSAAECQELNLAPDQALAFLNGWTRKEAYLKAVGVGCFAPLTEISVSLSGPALLVSTGRGNDSASDWTIRNLPHPRGIVVFAIGPLSSQVP